MLKAKCCIFLALALVLPQALGQITCSGRRIGYKLQDPEDCHGYYVCLGGFGELAASCGLGYIFDEPQQRCIVGKCPPKYSSNDLTLINTLYSPLSYQSRVEISHFPSGCCSPSQQSWSHVHQHRPLLPCRNDKPVPSCSSLTTTAPSIPCGPSSTTSTPCSTTSSPIPPSSPCAPTSTTSTPSCSSSTTTSPSIPSSTTGPSSTTSTSCSTTSSPIPPSSPCAPTSTTSTPSCSSSTTTSPSIPCEPSSTTSTPCSTTSSPIPPSSPCAPTSTTSTPSCSSSTTTTPSIPCGPSSTTSTPCTTTSPTTTSAPCGPSQTTSCPCHIGVTTPSYNDCKSVIPDCSQLKNGAYVRDAAHCNMFYVCVSNRAYVQYCPEGLYFDDVKNVCNYKNLVKCTNCSPHPVSTIAPCQEQNICKNMPNGSFLRDTKNCNKYYTCNHGQAIPQYCPRGQYFDNINYVCNFEYLVKNCKA